MFFVAVRDGCFGRVAFLASGGFLRLFVIAVLGLLFSVICGFVVLIKETALIELRGTPGRVLTDNYLINLFQETRASTGCFRGLGFSTFLCHSIHVLFHRVTFYQALGRKTTFLKTEYTIGGSWF